jgi:hypothetical protein
MQSAFRLLYNIIELSEGFEFFGLQNSTSRISVRIPRRSVSLNRMMRPYNDRANPETISKVHWREMQISAELAEKIAGGPEISLKLR